MLLRTLKEDSLDMHGDILKDLEGTKRTLPINLPPQDKEHICPHTEYLEALAEEFFGITSRDFRRIKGFCGNYGDGSYANDGSGADVQDTMCLRLYGFIRSAIEEVEISLQMEIKSAKKDIHSVRVDLDGKVSDFSIYLSTIAFGFATLDCFKKKHPELQGSDQFVAEMKRKVEELKKKLLSEFSWKNELYVDTKECSVAPHWG